MTKAFRQGTLKFRKLTWSIQDKTTRRDLETWLDVKWKPAAAERAASKTAGKQTGGGNGDEEAPAAGGGRGGKKRKETGQH